MTLLSLREFIAMYRSSPVRASSFVSSELFGPMPANWTWLADQDEDIVPWSTSFTDPALLVNSTRAYDSNSRLDKPMTTIILEYFLIIVFLPIFPSIFFSLTYKFTDPKRFMNFI